MTQREQVRLAALVPLADLHSVEAVSAVSTARLPAKKGAR
jgi:hypothetical protein